jgi:hypothetical protein
MDKTKTLSAGEDAYHVNHLRTYRIAREIYYESFDRSKWLAKSYPSVQAHELLYGAVGFTANTLRGCIDLIELRIDIELMLPRGMKVVIKDHGLLVMFEGQFPGTHPELPLPIVTNWLGETERIAYVD